MANGHGGYRQPTNAAPVSGPGALSQRTDGPMRGPVPDAASAAPAGAPPGSGQPAMGPDPSQVIPFGAPSMKPEEDIFAGMSGGPGAGPNVPPPSGLDPQTADRMRSYLPVLIFMASMPEASPATKQYVRQLRGELG